MTSPTGSPYPDKLRVTEGNPPVPAQRMMAQGTRAKTAERTGLRFTGCDIDPAYIDVALERWSSLAGLEPLRVLDREAA